MNLICITILLVSLNVMVVNSLRPGGLRCWSCEQAFSENDCHTRGHLQFCKHSTICFVEWRSENGLEILHKGCKQKQACTALEMQNPPQCNPEKNPSVCRYCCESENCNKDIKLVKPTVGPTITTTPKTKSTTKGNENRRGQRNARKECSFQSTMIPSPPELKPRAQCEINVPSECIAQGSLVLNLEKLPAFDRMQKMLSRNISRRCHRNPVVETSVVYDDGDRFVLVTKINYRFANFLPTDSFTHTIGDIPLLNLIRAEKDRKEAERKMAEETKKAVKERLHKS